MKTVLVALCAALVLAAAAAAGTSTSRLRATHASDQATLTVSMMGPGTGSVTSDPAGISCGATCSAQFAVGTTVSLRETPSAGSEDGDHSENCLPWGDLKTGPIPGLCRLTLTGDTSVLWSFNLIPHCVVPKVTGYILYVAKLRLRSGYCGVGTIRRVFSRRVEKTVVISQTPRPGTQRARGIRVNLVVSRGRRHAR
jgi:hypothetical protein